MTTIQRKRPGFEAEEVDVFVPKRYVHKNTEEDAIMYNREPHTDLKRRLKKGDAYDVSFDSSSSNGCVTFNMPLKLIILLILIGILTLLSFKAAFLFRIISAIFYICF